MKKISMKIIRGDMKQTKNGSACKKGRNSHMDLMQKSHSDKKEKDFS